ncbi:TPA: serum opacification factor [Streptococcus pyogenes]|nr:fibronectin binding protein [Streptococcus pyogenes]
MTNCKYKLRKLSVGLVSVGTMLIAPTVLGQEVSTTGSTETSAASTTTNTASTVETSTTTGTSVTAASEASSESSDASVVSSGGRQTSESAQASKQPQAQTAVASSSSSSKANESSSSASDVKAPKAVSTTSSSATVASPSNGSNKEANAETEPQQMMEVEKYTVDKENSELKVKDGTQPKKGRTVNENTKLIRNRDGKQRDIVDVTRTVKTNEDGTIDVTVTVKPKQIDEGADVMALLDVSKKMTQENFDKAKEQIKKMVTTLTSKTASGEQENHNRRNSVRLITFYRKVNEPIELTAENVEAKLKEVWEQAKKDWDWGVDLQGAIHKAREIFNKEKEKKSGKRQHIVLFSQGESTFSYDILKEKKDNKNNTVKKNRIAEKVTTSNPLFPWLPIFNHTHQKADMLDDVKQLIQLGEKLGIEGLSGLNDKLRLAGVASGFAGTLLGGGSLTEYLSLQEYQTDKLSANHFNYEKRVGEGYYYHSFSERKISEMPNRSLIKQQLEGLFKDQEGSWFKFILEKLSLTDNYQKAKEAALLKLLDYLFYKREYIYYNHNLSAIAEAQMAQQEDITFYSVDVTDLNTARRVKRQTATYTDDKKKEIEKIEKERNNKFDDYLKKMSEGGKEFFTGVDKADKFKDTLTELKIKDEFTSNVTVQNNSEGTKYTTSLTNGLPSVSHSPANDGWFNSTKESLTWTISKDQLKEAFEKNGFLTFKYKLRVNKDKLLGTDKKRTKRDTSTENKTPVTKDIISNTITYKINDQEVKGNKLDDVKLTYTKETVPVPDVEGTVEVPQAPEKPLVDPILPPQPSLPNIPTPQLPKDEDLEISGGHGPIVDIVEDTGTGVEGGAQNGVVSTQENKDPIVDITEDTQPGMSGSNDATVVEEDTAPKRPDVLVGGQSDPIDITEDTQPSVSGSNDATVVEEDTAPKRPDILVGGQSDPIDITEDTQPGMSGSNDATVIEEDTKPKRFFHFDNEPQAPEKPKEQPSLQDSNSLPQAPAYKAAHHLPASGDKREVYFTIAALTIIGAAGLLSKKRRDTEEN